MLIDDIRTLVDIVIIDLTQADLVSRAVLSHGVDVSLAAQVKEGLHSDHCLADVFSLLPQNFFVVFSSKLATFFITFFIGVLTWCEQQRALEALLYQCCIHFIDKECWWHYKEHMLPLSQDGLLLQGRVFLDLKLYWVYLPGLLLQGRVFLDLKLLSGLPPLSLVGMLGATGGRFSP